ncbi:bifunctional 4-hydroxy-2-oxoglutarate aldolase/2-dehydro-3-deoxy-phosphogluconate aldolase [Cyanobacterium aponinum]|uniref:Bifunctional 4-hydroxy-2-oxoglutarate aldolase/2-dehydro-3-deoxy-phosphogluconate aldolase n=1 Tax=Cyanobacterium aponinum 0216 TaxID=2676140 RepID=A0A844GSU3_9CHRO|nr:bifunctional 4-hydroxy-2-oxoglutarate aldolase/2-dehydro-3-deoxy-phosphogluconate aldolase [Cyanobacterium aponinum]MTF37989.1 bifunctional 4-hydroxy-2-oxoglutarate aldolase/2-dehydro-3-deoxy-phosphogluconate aldolase [Cyanobacterium aponinum 0216]
MLDRWLSVLQKNRLIAVIRCNNLDLGRKQAHAMAKAGVKLIEVTGNSYQPLELISTLRDELPSCYIGAGTILSHDFLTNAIASGIQFCFTPHFDPDLLALAHYHNIPMIPGALSPTEIITAFNYGAKTVKVFPIQSVGGVTYLKNILAPLPHIPLIPTGGVNITNAVDYIKAGAIAIGLASDLFPTDLIMEDNWQEITNRTKKLLENLEKLQ